jgi:hypothetical protein
MPLWLGSALARGRELLPNAVWRLSPRARTALSLGLLAALLLGLSAALFLPSATLQLVCRHDQRNAELTVSIDGEVVHTEALTGAVRKWFGVLERTEGSYATTLSVATGRHVVGIRLRAPGYDRTRSIEGEFSRGKESTLSVDAVRGLSLAWRGGGSGAGASDTPSASSGWLKYAGSIVMTIFGSIVSASIGVLVQDYLRARKARGDATGEIRPRQ